MKLLGKNSFLCWVLFFSITSHAALEELEQALVVLEDRLVTLSVTLSDLLLQTKTTTEPTSSLDKQKAKALLIAKLAAAHKKASKQVPDQKSGTKSDTKSDIKKSYTPKPGELEGENIVLKPYARGMLDAYCKNFTSQVRATYGSEEWTNDQVKKWLIWKLHDKNLKILHYCIFDKLSDELIGEVEIRNDKGSGNFGIWINEKFWGKGIMKEAVKLIAQQFFKKYPYLDEFDSQVVPDNIKSLSAHYKTFKGWGQAPNGNFRFVFTKDMLAKMLKNK